MILSQFCLTGCHVRQKEKKEVADFLPLQLFEHLSYLNQYSNPGFVKFRAKLSVIIVQITSYNLSRWTALHTKTTSTNLCIKGWIVIVKTTVDVVFILTNEMHSLQHFVKLLIFRKIFLPKCAECLQLPSTNMAVPDNLCVIINVLRMCSSSAR